MAEKATAINIAKQFVEAVNKSGVPIYAAYVFGSYAKGLQHEYSDIDLALISDIFTWNFIENNHKTSQLNYKYYDIEVHHFNTQAFTNDDPFINEIKRTGIKIY